MFEGFRSLRKFSIGGTNHKERIEHKKDNCSSLRPLRSLRLNLSFTLVSASPRWVLRNLRGDEINAAHYARRICANDAYARPPLISGTISSSSAITPSSLTE